MTFFHFTQCFSITSALIISGCNVFCFTIALLFQGTAIMIYYYCIDWTIFFQHTLLLNVPNGYHRSVIIVSAISGHFRNWDTGLEFAYPVHQACIHVHSKVHAECSTARAHARARSRNSLSWLLNAVLYG